MDASESHTPESVGPYRILRALGSGGGGSVYLAKAVDGTEVAVKVIHGHLAQDPTARGRIAREMQMAGRVRSDATVKILDADTRAAQPWLAMEYLDGPTLSEHPTMEEDELRPLGLAILQALSALHDEGITHRDLKPSNIIITDDGPKLIDFGVAADRGGTRLTATGQLLGTPEFMAPEQLTGGEVSSATDIWAWGILMAMAGSAGVNPFGEGNTLTMMRRIVDETPDFSGAPAWLRRISWRCLAKDPAERATVEELAELLTDPNSGVVDAAALNAEGAEWNRAPSISSAPESPAKAPSAFNWRVMVGAVGLLLVGVLGATQLYNATRTDRTAQVLSSDQTVPGSTAPTIELEVAPITAAPDPVATPAERGCVTVGSTTAEQRVARLSWLNTTEFEVIDSAVPVSCELVTVYQNHSNLVLVVDVLASGLVASGDQAGRVQVWDPSNGSVPLASIVHDAPVSSLLALPDGRVASGSEDATVRIWDPATTGDPDPLVLDAGSAVTSLAVLDTGRLVGGTAASRILSWDLNDLEAAPQSTTTVDGGEVSALIALPDGRLMSGTTGSNLQVWSAELASESTIRPPGAIESLAPLGGDRVAVALGGRGLWIYDLGDPENPMEIVGAHFASVRAVHALPDGRLASAGNDNTVRIWSNDVTGEPQVLEGHTGNVLSLASFDDGRLVSGGNDTTVIVWDPSLAPSPALAVRHNGGVLALGELPDGRLVSAAEDGSVIVWNPDDLNDVQKETAFAGTNDLLVTADGEIVTVGFDTFVRIWNADDLSESRILGSTGESNYRVLELPDGRLITAGGGRLTGESSAGIRIWDPDVSDSEPILLPSVHDDQVRDIALMPDGRLVSASLDSTLAVWDLTDLDAAPLRLEGHEEGVTSVAVTNDGRIVSAGRDHEVRVWDLSDASPESELVLEAHQADIRDLAVLDDGRIASISYDTTLRIWNIADAEDVTHTVQRLGYGRAVLQRERGDLVVSLGNGWIVGEVK